jgi:hypothetical protein
MLAQIKKGGTRIERGCIMLLIQPLFNYVDRKNYRLKYLLTASVLLRTCSFS